MRSRLRAEQSNVGAAPVIVQVPHDDAALDALRGEVQGLRDANQRLVDENGALRARIAALEAQIAKLGDGGLADKQRLEAELAALPKLAARSTLEKRLKDASRLSG